MIRLFCPTSSHSLRMIILHIGAIFFPVPGCFPKCGNNSYCVEDNIFPYCSCSNGYTGDGYNCTGTAVALFHGEWLGNPRNTFVSCFCYPFLPFWRARTLQSLLLNEELTNINVSGAHTMSITYQYYTRTHTYAHTHTITIP